MSDLGLPGDPDEGRRRRAAGSAWRRALVYFGLATGPSDGSDKGPLTLGSLARRVDEQEAAIADLRAEVGRLRARER